MPDLFSPIQIGPIQAKNRIFMAPLTRARATPQGVPTDAMVEYYKQRATAGLIFTEGVGITRDGLGWPCAPGIWSEEQVEKWKPVTQAVHNESGKIFLQLWHTGRAGHSSVLGTQPVSSSATSYPYPLYSFDGKKDPEVARVLDIEEIPGIVKNFATAAKNAIRAGFDGVQIHGANGYLIDQFLRDNSNFRKDKYGGSIGNRIRFLDEVVTAVIDAVGADRTSIRLSPNGDTQGCLDSDPEALFSAVAELLQRKKVVLVELREVGKDSTFGDGTSQPKVHGLFRKLYKGVLVLNQDYSREQAIKEVADGTTDAIAFGRKFISNPSLVAKLKENRPTRDDDMSTWYSEGPKGYTDYPID